MMQLEANAVYLRNYVRRGDDFSAVLCRDIELKKIYDTFKLGNFKT